MPQYEIKDTESSGNVAGTAKITRVRARSAVEAIRSHLDLATGFVITIQEGIHFEGLEGWRDATVDGEHVAQIREFQRMKFRRA